MCKLKVLKVVIYQPQAHYRIPFTYQRRHTYPIPPYSTVIGLLCNILGIVNPKGEGEPDDENYKNKLKEIKISICGNFKSKTTEYIWFRNLSKKSHNDRFGYPENRSISGYVEHPGGQIPVLIDILNDVKLWIYLYHGDENFLQDIKNAFENPKDRLYPLHLGRAEDWIVIEKLAFVELENRSVGGNYNMFFWIPKNIFNSNLDFEKIGGLIYKIPTFYKLVDGRRDFNYIDAKLNDGEIVLSKFDINLPFDKDEKIPVFLAKLLEDRKWESGQRATKRD